MSDAGTPQLRAASLPVRAPRRDRTRAAGARRVRREPLLPAPTVVLLACLGTASLALLDRSWTGRLSMFFDLCFVLVCIVAALAVRRSGLFTVGVAPPLVLGVVLTVFTLVDPATLTAQHLAFISTLLTGLAHHATALVAGHGSAIAILAARGTIDAEAADETAPEPS